ncbi:MAG TPA: hypothetical protein VGX95_00700 [Xanthobacteraceae bacterium]|jgi:hypothetical protein|nr:hypothetical protein [Xanthobacteraceae bacterium]
MIRLRTRIARTGESLPLALVCFAVALLATAGAQEPPRAQPEPPAATPAPAPQPGPPAVAPAPAPQPGPAGPFGTIGRFIDESFQGLGQGLKGAREQMDDLTGRAGNAAKDAAGSIRLRRPTVVAGHERCLPAPNGAPDCVTATAVMCRANGYQTGSSIDMQTEQMCPAATPAGPASPPLDESQCWLESYVIRALCR